MHDRKFAEGDKVRNTHRNMGTGVITRHSTGPRSVRWVTDGRPFWWVVFPDFHDPKWADPAARGIAGWFLEDALTPDSEGYRAALIEVRDLLRRCDYSGGDSVQDLCLLLERNGIEL